MTTTTPAAILQAISLAECIASNLACGAFDIARQEIAREDLAGARRILLAVVNDASQPVEMKRTVKSLLIHLGTVYARIGDGQRDKAASRAPAIRDYCRAIRDYLGTVTPVTAPAAPATAVDDEPIGRLDEVCGVLTPGQQRIVRYLWNRKHRADRETLAKSLGMSPEPSSIKEAFKRLSKRLIDNGINDVYLDSNKAGRMKLVHP